MSFVCVSNLLNELLARHLNQGYWSNPEKQWAMAKWCLYFVEQEYHERYCKPCVGNIAIGYSGSAYEGQSYTEELDMNMLLWLGVRARGLNEEFQTIYVMLEQKIPVYSFETKRLSVIWS